MSISYEQYRELCRRVGQVPKFGPLPDEPKPTKWHNVPCEWLGIKFGSGAEKDRYAWLLLLQRAGRIANLKAHQTFPFVINGERLWTYTSDATYTDSETGAFIVEDVKNEKNAKSRDFVRNCKLMWALFQIRVKVIIR